jgi:hypothetical protein
VNWWLTFCNLRPGPHDLPRSFNLRHAR